MADDIQRIYRVTPPDGDPFLAAVVKVGDGYGVVSQRTGQWAKDDQLHFADLLMPEQHLADWDITELEAPPAA